MTIGTRRTSKRNSQKDKVLITSGEIFSDGVLDLVASADGRRPDLLFWDGERATVAPQIQHGGVVYQAAPLHPSIGHALRLPRRLNRCGTPAELFGEVASLFERYFGLRQEIALGLSLWNASTWLSDVLPSPPALVISGPDMAHAMTLFNLLSCVSRRALRLAGISRTALVGLPMHLRPALLINGPAVSHSTWELLRSSNHRGLCVPGRGGAILDWVCSKAVFLGVASGANVWSDEALSVSLPPAEPSLPILDEQAVRQIAQDFQARFLGFRLDWLKRQWEACSPDRNSSFPGSELAQNLFACVQHEPELIKQLTPLLHSQQEEAMARQKRDPNSVILEVIWDPAHRGCELGVKKITEYLNVVLQARGEKYTYLEEEIGWKLKQFGFERHRSGSGMVLRFSGGNTRLVHQLARNFGLHLPKVQGCSDCAEPEAIIPVVVQDV